jgi:RTX calcium-binding nonapeptide repeat (4 copies)
MSPLQNPNARLRTTKNSSKNELRKRLMRWRSPLNLEVLEDRTVLSVGADVKSAIDSVLTPLNSALSGKVFGVDIPIVGSALKNSDTAKFLTNLQSTLDAGAATLDGETDVTKIAGDLQNALGLSSPNSVTASVNSAGDTTFVIHLENNLATINTGSFNFDIGLPGLGLKTTGGGLTVMLGYKFNLDLVVPKDDPAGGIYFVHDPNHEFSLTAQIGLSNNFSISGTLGFLQVNINDGTFTGFTPAGDKTSFNPSFTLDLNPPGGKLALTDIPDILGDITATVSGEAKVNLGMVVSFNGSTQFPTVAANFQLDWKFDTNSDTTTGGMLGSQPTVDFNNVQIDLGTFFSQFVEPILADIQTVTKPLQPIIDFVTAPIPVISDLEGHSVSLLDLAGDADPSDVSGIEAIVKVVGLINSVPKDATNVGIQLGNFNLGSMTDLRGATPDFNGLDLTKFALPTDILTQLQKAGVSLPTQEFVKALMPGTDNVAGLSFPILDDPGSVFGLFIGRKVNLFTATLPDIDLEQPFNEFFSILGPLGVRLKGSLPDDNAFELHTSLTFGYDTYGLSIGKPLEGFFVENATATLSAGVEADLELNLAVASAGVGGSISGTVKFGLHDPRASLDPARDDFSTNPPTPLIREDDIENDLMMGAFCIFDVSGSLDAKLHAYVKVGFDTPFGFVGWSDDYTIAEVMLTFATSCDGMDGNPQPTLAHVSTGSGEDAGIPAGYLILNIGPYAHDRGVGDTDDEDEDFSVTHQSGTAGDEMVQVAGEGSTQQFSDIKGIWAEGGEGNNTITIKPGVLSPATIYGGFDTSLVGHNSGGEGNNVLTGGDGTTFIQAGPDQDRVNAGSGNTTVYGGGGGDTITGGAGNDYIDGIKGNNRISGGTGVSTLIGGSQSSTTDVNIITMGTGDDTAIGGHGFNVFIVNNPADSILASHASGISITGSGASNGTGGGNELILNSGGGPDFTETYNFGTSTLGTGNGAGNIVTTNGALTQTINYTGLSPIFDTVTVGTLNDNAATTSQINVIDAPLNLSASESQFGNSIVSDTGALTEIRDDSFEPTFIGNKTTVNINGNDGGGTVYLDNLHPAAGLVNVNVNLGAGTNIVNVEATGAGVTTTVDGAKPGSSNTFNVGLFFIKFPTPSDPSISFILPTVDSIQGSLVLEGAGTDSLNVDDIGSSIAKTGTLTASTITGLGMGPQGITYSGISILNVDLGSSGNVFNINDAAGQDLPATTTINGGSSHDDQLAASWGGDMNGTLDLVAFEFSTMTISGNLNGTLSDTAPGTVQSVAIGGSITAPGVLQVFNSSDPANPTTPSGLLGDIGTMTVGGSIAGLVKVSGNITTLTVGTTNAATTGGVNDVSGQVLVGGALTTASVSGDVSGAIEETLTVNSLFVGGSLTSTGLISAVNIIAALGNINILTIGANLAGTLIVSGTLGTFNLGGSLTNTGVITVGSLNSMTIGGDLAGQLRVLGMLKMLTVHGGTPGTVVAGQIGTISVFAGFGPVVAQINENGIQRRIEAAVPSAPFPTPLPPPAPTPTVSPAGITFQYFYEGLVSPSVEGLNPSTNLANPQLTARVANATGNTGPDQFDFSLITYNDTAKFNLARLDSASVAVKNPTGVSGIRNVSIEGDILTGITTAASTFFAPDSSPAGIFLPKDNLAGVGVRDFVPDRSINARSIQAVAFGSFSERGRLETGVMADDDDAEELLAPSTAIVQAGSSNGSTLETFRVPFADLATQQVGFFMDDSQGGGWGQFDDDQVVLIVQSVSTANSSGTGNNVAPSNVARGAVVALITVAETFDQNNHLKNSVIENISLRGDGGSIQTQQTIGSFDKNSHTKTPFTPSITSTGPLGDVIIEGPLPNVTAPSIFGSLLPDGPIPATSTIQTTGLRTDPITSAISQVPADLGRIFVVPTYHGPYVTVTQVLADGPGLSGQIICGGNLISQVVSDGPTSGMITVQPVAWEPGAGNLGATFTYPSGHVLLLGGFISYGPMIAPTVSVGDKGGTTTVNGLLQGGTITTYGSVLGDIFIDGSMNGPSVCAGNNGTAINLNGTLQGGFITTFGSVIGDITIDDSMNGPTLVAGNNSTVINVNGAVQGGFITTFGSVLGDISIGDSVNGPTIVAGNNGTVISVNGTVQGGFLTTNGSAVGDISIGSEMSGPTVVAGNNRTVINLNGPVQGGSVTTFGSVTGAITICGPVDAPTLCAGNNGSAINANVPVQGGSILTGGSLGDLTIGGPLSGQVVTIGNMNGTVTIDGPVQGGVIATSGSINGNLTIGGPLSGELLAAGNINGNVTIYGGLQSGRIASLGSILGNLTIHGWIDSQSALVSGGSIGGPNGKLYVGDVYGIVAAVGSINVGQIGRTNTARFYRQNDTVDSPVIDAIFSQGVSSLSATDLFDQTTPLDLDNLDQILANLNSLTFNKSTGKLQL